MGKNVDLTEERFIEGYLTESHQDLTGTSASGLFDMRNGHYMRITRLRIGKPEQNYRIEYLKMGKQGLEDADYRGGNLYGDVNYETVGFANLLGDMKRVASHQPDKYAHLHLALDALDKKPVNYFEVLNAVQPPEPGNVRVEGPDREGKYYEYSRKPKPRVCVHN
ncbi:MAG: hypothetical protein PHY92_09700 [Alphaproteobacteria bacterium]|nr:hypothetical protein [Alphaproteobacteria bacterium]